MVKFYFYSFHVREDNKQTYFINDVSARHPFQAIIELNELATKNESNRFCTLISFQEITGCEYDIYKANERFI